MSKQEPQQQEDPDVVKVRAALETLIKHFDTVHIFVTRHDPATENGTMGVNLGRGSYYARFGQIYQWIRKQISAECLDATDMIMDPSDSDDEDDDLTEQE